MSDRDPATGRLVKGHTVRPLARGGPTESELIRRRVSPHRDEILDKMIVQAKEGDTRSAEIVLRWLAPVARPDAERVVVPGLRDAVTLVDKAAAILAAVAEGHVSAEAGDRLLSLLDKMARVVSVDDHEARLRAIEQGKTPAAPLPAADVIDNDYGDFA